MFYCFYAILKAILITIVISFFFAWRVFRQYLRRQEEMQKAQETPEPGQNS